MGGGGVSDDGKTAERDCAGGMGAVQIIWGGCTDDMGGLYR